MKIVERVDISLTSTTVSASALDEYASGTSYTSGDQVKVSFESDGTTPMFPVREYQATGSTTGDYPPDAAETKWVELGAQNAHKMFDGQNNSKTTDSDSITVEFDATGYVDCVAVFGMENVESAELTIEAGGSTVYSSTKQLGSVSLDVGWYGYLYNNSSVYTKPSAVWYFSQVLNPTVTITLTGVGAIAVAQAMPGSSWMIGSTLDGPQPRIRSFSTKEFDATLGATTFVARDSVRSATYQFVIDNGDFDEAYGRMETLTNVLCLFDGNNEDTDYDSLRVYGWVEEYQPELLHPSKHPATLRVQGIS